MWTSPHCGSVVDLSTWPGEACREWLAPQNRNCRFTTNSPAPIPQRVGQGLRRHQFVIRPFRTAGVAAPTNFHRKKEAAMKHVAIKHIALKTAHGRARS
jgi:hypothetical protein